MREIRDLLLEHFERPADVRLEDDPQRVALELLEQLLERDVRLARQLALADLLGAPVGELLRLREVRDRVELVARAGELVEAADLDRRRRPGLGHELALVVLDRADAAVGGAADEDVALLERPVRDQQAGHVALAAALLGLEDRSDRRALRVRLELEQVALEREVLEEVRDAGALHRRHVDRDRLAAPLFRLQPFVRELLAHLHRVRAGEVDLLTATTIGTFAARACAIASFV